jgi:hypothetical protein
VEDDELVESFAAGAESAADLAVESDLSFFSALSDDTDLSVSAFELDEPLSLEDSPFRA